MGFRPSNVMTKAFIMKFVELFFVFIVFLLFRVGQKGDIFYWGAGPQYPPTTSTTTTPTTTTPTTTTPTTTTPTTPNPTTTTPTTTTTTTPTSTATNPPSKKIWHESPFGIAESAPGYHAVPYVGAELELTESAENDLIFGVLTSVGYFFITIVLMVGILMGDKQKFTMLLFNLFGFLFFLALGSRQVHVYRHMDSGKSKARGMGAMAIMTSFTFMVDTIFSVLEVKNGDGD